MWNARLDETQAGIKIAGRNINNLRYADNTTFMAESKEELKSLLMEVKGKIDFSGNERIELPNEISNNLDIPSLAAVLGTEVKINAW